MRWVTYNSISLATGTGAKIYRANSMYDPDYSGAGDQPLGYDQWTAFYQRYKVYAIDYKVTFVAASSVAESIVGVVPCLTASPDTAAKNAFAETYAKAELWSANGGFRPVVSGHLDMRKFVGATKQEFGEENYSGPYNNDPTSVVWFHVRADTIGGGASGTMYFYMEIDFDCEFYQRAELDLSLWKEFRTFKTEKDHCKSGECIPLSSQNPPVTVQREEKDVKELLARLLNK